MAETLITSSVLILGVCLLRFVLRGRISPGIRYGMWAAVALRLVIPWFYPVFGWFKVNWIRSLGMPVESPFSVMNAAGTLRDMVSGQPGMGQIADELSAGQAAQYPDPAAVAGQTAGADWQLVILIVWVLGGILLFAWMMWTNVHFSRRLYMQRERYKGDTYGMTDLPVYCVRDLNTPCFMVYLADRAIYIPAETAVNQERISHILIHEDCHARHRDHLWSVLRCVLLCYYWINPLVWVAAVLSKRDCELACDALAVKRLGDGERISYGSTLIELTAQRKRSSGFLNVSSDMWSGNKAVRERIVTLAKHPRTTRAAVFLIVIALGGLIVCTYTGQKQQERITARAQQWAEAFCDRNGRELYLMYLPEYSQDFYEMEHVYSQPEDEFISFGWSSPWPMDHLYGIDTEGKQSEITYYAMTSDPHRWVWKEWITWTRENDTWYAKREAFREYSDILSAEAYYEAYGQGITGTPMDYQGDGMAENLNRQAQSDPVYRDLLTPELAMEFLLNLHGGRGTAVIDGTTATVVYTFPDGSRGAAVMAQPFGPDGIWIPAEVADVADASDMAVSSPEDAGGTSASVSLEDTGAMDSGGKGAVAQETVTKEGITREGGTKEAITKEAVTIEDVVELARISDAGGLDHMKSERLTAKFPQPDRVEDDADALNLVEHYTFEYEGEPYELQISYEKKGGDLYYVIAQRLNTGEWLNLFQTPEDVKRYGMEPAGEADVRSFFDTHTQMTDYLNFRLPKSLSHGGFLRSLGNGGGGELFLTSDPAEQSCLEELSRHVDQSVVPPEWRSAGAVQRYTGDGLFRRFVKGNLTEIGLPWNHSEYLTEPVSVADCEAPALLILVQHDMYTPASLADIEEAYGPMAEENRTSRMWYVFFARPDSKEIYSISMNADLYKEEDLLRVAERVHFTESAWTEP